MIERELARDLQSHFNLAVADWRVLALTCARGSSSAAKICVAFEIDRAEVSRAVSRLLKSGLVQREPDPDHRQKMNIIPTDAGKAIFDRAQVLRNDYFTAILQDLSPEESRNFQTALERIALRVDERRSSED